MVYRRSRPTSYRRRTGRYAPRRSIYRRKRMVYRRANARRTRTRGLPVKRIRNLTSRKKQDTMLSWAKPTPYVSGAVGSPLMTGIPNARDPGIQPYVYMYQPTARDLERVPGSVTNINDSSSRTSTNCYAVGLKERISLIVNSNEEWLWRRIVFTFKGTYLVTPQSGFGGDSNNVGAFYDETTVGFPRAWTQVSGFTASPGADTNALWLSLRSLLFKGTYQTDWNDFATAKADNSRLNILYDKQVKVQSPNDNGTTRTFNRWHPFRKRLIYNDDEVGGGKQVDVGYSSMHRASMGDAYVFDMFIPGHNSEQADELEVRCSSTYYWHET